MLLAGIQHHDRWLGKPFVHDTKGVSGIQWPRENARTGRYPQEPEDYDPRKGDRLVRGKCTLQPGLGRSVAGAVSIDRVQQNVDVDDLHTGYFLSANFRAISSSSRESARASALSSGRSGAPMAKVAQP